MTTVKPIAVSAAVKHALTYGCDWHGHLPSSCCECGMIAFWRAEIAAGRAVT